MASGIYNRFKGNLMKKQLDLVNDTVKVMLLNNSHAFNAAHTGSSQVSGNQLANGNGYATGGATLSGKSVDEAATTKWKATDVSWTEATFTAYHAVVYDTTAANSLICSFDFGGAQAVSAGTFTIKWHTDGLITLA